ncbi:MAG: quinone oxidoreductase [Rhodothermales bacterium]|nr:quinone oxidoreductase [Rhodothermales bacterium]
MAYSIVVEETGGPDALVRVDHDIPVPLPGQVLLRQTAVGVNFIDVYFRSGLYPWNRPEKLIPGSEAAGIVEALGEDVSNFSVGDRVGYTVPNGGYTSHRTVEEAHLVPIPDDVPDTIAAASLLKGLTVSYLLRDSYPVRSSSSVLFHAAAGGVGLMAGQWLKHLGVEAIGTAGGTQKCSIAARHGYANMIDYRSTEFVEAVMDVTNGQGVDVVYDSVGADTYPGSLQCLKTFGTLVNFGQSSGPALDFKLSDLAAGSFTVIRPILFHYTARAGWLKTASSELFGLIAKGELEINVGQTFPMAEASEAHRMLEQRNTTGSTVLIP